MSLSWSVLIAVVLQRVAELVYAARNRAALVRRGAVEVGSGHYPVMVLLHAGWLAAMAVGLWRDPRIEPLPLTIFLLLQPVRIWAIASLGPYWTTRVMTVPDAPLVRRGPYRYVRHPNYAVVAGEVAVLPLAFGQIRVAVAFSAANLVLLAWRIRSENAALATRRRLT